MAHKRAGGPPQESPPTSTLRASEVPSGSTGANSRPSVEESLVAGEKRRGICPGICGAEFDATWTGCDFFVGSFSTHCPGGGACLRSLAEAASDYWDRPLNGGHILSDPFRYLSPWLGRRNGRPAAAPRPLPSEATIDGYRSALWSDCRALRWLRRRELSDAVIRWAELGYDSDADAITLPVREAGALVNLRRRFLKADADPKIVGLGGRGSQLYPNVPSRGVLVLVAGEVDALIGRQHRLRTITTTCGAKLPDHLVAPLAGRHVAVMYDVGEELAAAATATTLRTAGSEAWVVRLARLGLPNKADLNEYLRSGGTAAQLRALIERERRAAA